MSWMHSNNVICTPWRESSCVLRPFHFHFDHLNLLSAMVNQSNACTNSFKKWTHFSVIEAAARLGSPRSLSDQTFSQVSLQKHFCSKCKRFQIWAFDWCSPPLRPRNPQAECMMTLRSFYTCDNQKVMLRYQNVTLWSNWRINLSTCLLFSGWIFFSWIHCCLSPAATWL